VLEEEFNNRNTGIVAVTDQEYKLKTTWELRQYSHYIQVVVFCVVTLCSDVLGYQCFGAPCCLHLQGEVSDFARHYSNIHSHITQEKCTSAGVAVFIG
jgi:hypothetical protein